MTKNLLEALLSAARGHTMTAQERREQGLSLIVGNESVEGALVHRGTVTMAVTRIPEPHRGTIVSTAVVEAPIVPFDVRGAARQFRLVRELVERHVSGETVTITEELIKSLHAAAGDGISPHYGAFRELPVEMRGSSHQPPQPTDIEGEVAAFCAELEHRWEAEDAFTLGAFSLWRLNWIHPFLDGNGRTARALSYLVLNLKLGMLLPGSPTLLEQLRERRDDYFDALTAADLGLAQRGTADLQPLRDLLTVLLERQLLSLPAVSGSEEARLSAIVDRRIGQLDSGSRELLFAATEVGHRAWSVGDYLLVHVGSKAALETSENLFALSSRPFPGLIAAPHQPAQLSVAAKQRGAVVRPRTFEVDKVAGLWLEPNAAITIERPSVVMRQDGKPTFEWSLSGALYVLRRGDEITDLWIHDVFDLLVSRHIEGAR